MSLTHAAGGKVISHVSASGGAGTLKLENLHVKWYSFLGNVGRGQDQQLGTTYSHVTTAPGVVKSFPSYRAGKTTSGPTTVFWKEPQHLLTCPLLYLDTAAPGSPLTITLGILCTLSCGRVPPTPLLVYFFLGELPHFDGKLCPVASLARGKPWSLLRP